MATIPVVPVVPFPSADHALDLCARLTRYVGEGAAILRASLGRLQALDEEVRRLTDLQGQAEELTEQLVNLVPRMLTLPSERVAVIGLTRALDDVLDDLDAALTRLLLFGLSRPSPLATALVGVLIQQAEALERAVVGLRDDRQRPAIKGHLALARGLSAEADGLLMQSYVGLGDDALDLTGVVEWLKWSEVHRPLAAATRHGRDAAEAIERLTARRV
ncbi:MAG TPA: hypothetical protein VII06_35015 [Chloroflexota bacterium]|jgi:hypothetical protein